MYSLLKRIYTQLLEMLFPSEKAERIFLSPESVEKIALLPRCGEDTVLQELQGTACFVYQNSSVKALIRLIKYRGNRHSAHLCGSALAEECLEILMTGMLFDAIETPLLIPIPISKERQRERGFNQSERLAKALIQHINEPLNYAPHLLTRKSTHIPQAQQHSKSARLKNMHNIFEASPTVSGKDIILLDDVITTGATMIDALRALKKAGARNIYCLALAH
jgi:ComF family protein